MLCGPFREHHWAPNPGLLRAVCGWALLPAGLDERNRGPMRRRHGQPAPGRRRRKRLPALLKHAVRRESVSEGRLHHHGQRVHLPRLLEHHVRRRLLPHGGLLWYQQWVHVRAMRQHDVWQRPVPVWRLSGDRQRLRMRAVQQRCGVRPEPISGGRLRRHLRWLHVQRVCQPRLPRQSVPHRQLHGHEQRILVPRLHTRLWHWQLSRRLRRYGLRHVHRVHEHHPSGARRDVGRVLRHGRARG